MRTHFTVRAALTLLLAATLAAAKPSPEADHGYSYKPPPAGVRLNYQPSWAPVRAESRSRASEVTVEQVPIRLVQQSSQLSRPGPGPSQPSGVSLNRGAYYFPSASARLQQGPQPHQPQQYYRAGAYLPQNNLNAGRQEQVQQTRGAYVFPSGGSVNSQQNPQQYVRNVYNYQQDNNGQQNNGQQNNRHSEIPQQRGAYVFPPQNNNQNNQPQQYLRLEQARNLNNGNNPGYQYNAPNNQYNAAASNIKQYNTAPGNGNQYNGASNNVNQYNSAQKNHYNSAPQNQYNSAPQNQYNSAPNKQYNGVSGSGNQNYNGASNNGNQYNSAPSNNNQNNAPTTGYQSTGPSGGYQYNTPNNGYNYDKPSSEAPQEGLTTTTEAAPTVTTTEQGPRITIAISKSTVIHTGKGSYRIDEKTGSPRPLIAEAHSYAGIPEPTKKPATGSDNLSGQGTGNFPIITRGTPPDDEEENEENATEEAETEANTEQPTTTEYNEDVTTPAPTAQSVLPVFSNAGAWPVKTYGQYNHAHVVIAPGQTQYFALGTSARAPFFAPSAPQYLSPTQYLTPASTQYLTPASTQYLQQTAVALPQYAHQYGAYHPSALTHYNSIARGAVKWPFAGYYPIVVRDPYASAYNQVVEYNNPDSDVCHGKVAPFAPTAAPVETTEEPRASEQEEESQQPAATQAYKANRMVIYRGGVAIAGPGGFADAGMGGTAIVGPGGTAYSSPNSVSIVGPGGKVLLQGASSETILAKGPIIYHHKV